MRWIYVLIFLWSGMMLGKAQGVHFVEGTYEEVLSLAHKENKLVFIDGYTTWCAPCKRMNQYVFPKDTVGKFLNEYFISAKFDMEKGDGLALRQKFEIAAYPTFLFLDAEGTLLHKMAGMRTVSELISDGYAAMDPDNRLSAMQARYEQGERDPEFLENLAVATFMAADPNYAMYADEYILQVPNQTSKKALLFAYEYANRANGPMWDLLVEHQQQITQYVETPSQVSHKIDVLIMEEVVPGDSCKPLGELQDIVRHAYPEQANQKADRFALTYHRQRGERELFMDAAVYYFNTYKNDIPAADLSEIAYTFTLITDNKKRLKQATKMAQSAIQSENNYSNNEVLAQIYKKMGKRKNALKYAYKAIDIAKSSGENYSDTEDLIVELLSK